MFFQKSKNSDLEELVTVIEAVKELRKLGYSNEILDLLKQFGTDIYPLLSDMILNIAELKAKANMKQINHYIENGLSQEQAINIILNDKTVDRMLKQKLLAKHED